MKKKLAFVIVGLVWLAVCLQFIINHKWKQQDAYVDAFSSQNILPIETSIQLTGDFGTMYISDETKEMLLKNLAEKLDLSEGYQVISSKGDDYAESTLAFQGDEGTVELQMLSIYSEDENEKVVIKQKLQSNITVYEDMELAIKYRDAIEKIYRDLGMTPGINIYVRGSLQETSVQ